MIVRTFARLIVLVMLVVATPLVAHAQYTVQPGDTLWRLSGDYLNDPMKWGEIIGANKFLKEPGRQFQLPDGRIVLLIRPGESLKGLNDLGIKAEPVSIDQLKPTETGKTLPTPPAPTKWYQERWFSLLLLLLILILAIGATFIALRQHYREEAARRERLLAEHAAEREREVAAQTAERERVLAENPITSGTPYVPGGIAPTETARLENFFDRQAATRYADRHPGTAGNTVRATRIGPIEEGTISGEGMVGYLGGEMRPRRIEKPIRAYQARYRFPDGTEELLQCLMGCMNPVLSGGDVYRGFVFTPAQIVVVERPEVIEPAPESATVVATEVALVPAIALAVAAQSAPEIGVLKLEFRAATATDGAMIRLTGVDEAADNTVEITPRMITVRFTPSADVTKSPTSLTSSSAPLSVN